MNILIIEMAKMFLGSVDRIFITLSAGTCLIFYLYYDIIKQKFTHHSLFSSEMLSYYASMFGSIVIGFVIFNIASDSFEIDYGVIYKDISQRIIEIKNLSNQIQEKDNVSIHINFNNTNDTILSNNKTIHNKRQLKRIRK